MPGTGAWGRFEDLVFSDLRRYRDEAPSWRGVLARLLTLPGLLASVVVRAQQVLFDSGRVRPASVLRTVGIVLVGIDVHPGPQIGRGLLLAHPAGVVIGGGVVIGDGVTFAGGVTCGVREPDGSGEQAYPTIGDGAILSAHAVVLGGVTVGRDALVGANSVVLDDVGDGVVVAGSPARPVGTRRAGDPA